MPCSGSRRCSASERRAAPEPAGAPQPRREYDAPMDLLMVLLAAMLQSPTPGPARGEVEVVAIGCVSGTTLTETNLTRNPSSGAENPARRWRLSLSKAQEKALKEIGPNQVEVFGFAREMELESASLVKTQKIGPGRA